MLSAPVQAYYRRFLASLPADSPYHACRWCAEPWGDSPALAEELGALIVRGIKTAACGTLWEYEAEGADSPALDLLTVVLDGSGQPLCIIETTQIEVKPFNQIDAAFAYAEGEGDRSYQYWHDEHWKYFTRTLQPLGRKPAEDMLLVCERFRVVYRES